MRDNKFQIIRSYFRTSMQQIYYQNPPLCDDHEDDEEEETLQTLTTEQISLTFRNLTKVVAVDDDDSDLLNEMTTMKRTLLHNNSGSVHPGEILAVMGPSGSGKTTLLDTLTNRSTLGVTGEILFNKEHYNHSQMKQKIAYVVQDDEFFDKLTVQEQLIFVARLKLPWHLTEKHVQLLIKKLNLHNSINLPIYLISTGEKKRLSIATALLTNPSILVLDEPTSGLDSGLALSLIQLLRKLADKQRKTIILSIHQPSSQIFQIFDQVMLISEGKIVFMNKPQFAVPYLMSLGYQCPDHFNPADYMMDLVSESNSSIRDRLVEEYVKISAFSEQGREQMRNTEETFLLHNTVYLYQSSFIQQFTVLFSRSLKLVIQVQLTRLYIIYTLFLTLFTSLCWFRSPFRESTLVDRFSYIFFVFTVWPVEVIMITLLNFPTERKLINREQQENGLYRLSAYFLGKLLAETPVFLTLPFIYLTVTYWIYNLNPYFINYIAFLFTQLLITVTSHAMSLVVSSTVHDPTEALAIASIILFGSILFGGFYVQNIPSWISWMKYLSFVKYAYDACLQITFSNNTRFQCDKGLFMTELCGRTLLNRTVFTGRDVLTEYYHIKEVIFEVLAFLALKFVKEKNKRQ